MRTRRLGFMVCGALLIALALPSRGVATPEPKVAICHATNSVEHPYNLDEVKKDSIVHPDGTPTGHGIHTGPVYPRADWGDIIPPFTYEDTEGHPARYPGLNWTALGQAIFHAGCAVALAEPPPTETTTTTEPATTTTEQPSSTTTTTSTGPTTSSTTTTTTTGPTTSSTTTTTSPPTTTTVPTTGLSTTTTTLSVPTTPTSAPPTDLPPPLTDPPPGVETMPPTEAVAVDPGDNVKDLGHLSPGERVELEAELDGPQLAYTGQNVAQLVVIGAIVAVAGGALVLAVRPRRRTVGRRPST